MGILGLPCVLHPNEFGHNMLSSNASSIFKYFSTNMYCCFYYYELKIMTIYESFFLNFYFDKYIINIQTIELNTNCYLFRIQSKYSHLFNLLFVSNVG